MKIKSQKDFWSGVMFLSIGVVFAVGARSYNLGTGARMGPGYFPSLLGVILALLGVAILVQSLRKGAADGDPVGVWAWKPIVYVLGANVVFGVLLGGLPSIQLPSFGLIAAIYALVLIASRAGEGFKLKDVLVLATILAVGSYAAFILLLKLQIPVWPAFLA
jgi:Tripartite tricarboxylate transporter TctB family